MTALIGDLARDEYEDRLRYFGLKSRRDPFGTMPTPTPRLRRRSPR